MGQSAEDSLDITTLLHGDDTGLVLFIDPEEERFGIVVEDTTSLGPVTLHSSDSQVTISTHEEEMIINKLLSDLLVHSSERIVRSSKIAGQLGQSAAHQLLNIDSLLLGDSGGQTKSINVPSNPDSGGVDRDFGINVADIHVRSVLGIRGDSMVFLDDGIKDLCKVLVRVPAAGIDATVLVVKFNSTSTGLGEGETTGLGLNVLHLIPAFLGHMLSHKGVLRLDFREFSRHVE